MSQNKKKSCVIPEDKKNKVLENIPTAYGLANYRYTNKCKFCGNIHATADCTEARKWSLAERVEKVKEKGCCLRCLTFGHLARRCRVNVKCSLCGGKHVDIMCLESDPQTEKVVEDAEVTIIENSLTNMSYAEVFLQTLKVNLNGKNKSRPARVLIDSGSQRSYITKAAASELEYEPIGQEQMIHALFGGVETSSYIHNCYKIRLSSMTSNYACNFDALDQTVICSSVNFVKHGPWSQELKKFGIQLSDDKDGPIDILIGSDILGKLFTGKRIESKCGLIAMETLLGWTLFGKFIGVTSKLQSSLLTTLVTSNENITNLWKLDLLGLEDEKGIHSKEEHEANIVKNFSETVKRKQNGRYEVQMPWVQDHPPLPLNVNIAEKRKIVHSENSGQLVLFRKHKKKSTLSSKSGR